MTIFLNLSIIFFWGNSLAGQTPRRIFTLDDSNDADSRNGVHLGGFVDIVSLFVGEIPPPKKKFSPAILGLE